MKQTAVEYLVSKLNPYGLSESQTEYFEQAKEMEKQQGYSEEDLEVAFFEGRENNLTFSEWFNQYKKK